MSLSETFIPEPEESADIRFSLYPGRAPLHFTRPGQVTASQIQHLFLTADVLIGNIHRHSVDDFISS